jgi:hypothetical protein
MREFNDADRKKKRGRIRLPENPGNLSADALTRLQDAVETAVKDGYVACPTAWNVAKNLAVSRLDVGVMIDRLGIRVTDCQLGCFAVSKADHTVETPEPFGAEIAHDVAALHERGELTCPNIFALAGERNVRPRAVADAANVQGYKLGGCQLGCF